MNPQDNTPMQTLCVHVDQLTPANLIELGNAGYTILRDPNILVFARPLPPPQQVSVIEENEELAAAPPTPIHSGNSNKKPR